MDHHVPETDAETLDALPREDLASVQSGTALGRKELSGRLAGLSLHRQVFVLAIWPFVEQSLNFLVGFVDTALAGRLSVEATNGIAIAAYVGWLINLVQSSVGIGSTAIIARATGGRHKRVANAALGQSILLALVVGSGMGVCVFMVSPWLAGFTGLTGESAAHCVTYLRIIAVASPLSAVLFVGAACLRGAGDTRTPSYVLIGVNIVNTGVSISFVKYFDMGVAGIAYGTFAGWIVGAVLIMFVLIRGWGGIRLRWIRLRPHWHTAMRILRIGIPNFFEMFLALWVANFIVLRIVGMLGNEAAWGAHLIGVRIEAISYLPGFAMGVAAATLVGQYLGLGDPARARRAAIICWQGTAAIMFVWGLIFIVAPWPLVRIITDQPALLELSPPLLRIAGFIQVLFATSIVLGQAMRGAGDTRTTLWLTALSTYCVRLPLVYLFGIVLGWGLNGVWIGLCAEIGFRGVIFAIRFFHGGWMKTQV